MKKLIFLFFSVILVVSVFAPCGSAHPAQPPLVQLAILLDTSNSMDGLIEQAKSQLWAIVNQLAQTRKNGKSPRLEVALYEYGNNNIPRSDGYVRLIAPFCSDLDLISEELFGLRTNGGDEYCGLVIHNAIQNLRWSHSNDDLKMVVIAGNEPFTQGNIGYQYACRNAMERGIVVNTIFCGNYQEGVETKWKSGADLTEGSYTYIDQDLPPVDIHAPQDDEITKLGQEMNDTYIPFGVRGQLNKERQEAQDTNAQSVAGEAAVQRSVTKASKLYDNTAWDLVDAVKANGYDFLAKVKADELPPEMQKMSPTQRKSYVAEKIKEREELQEKINRLSQERQVYITKEQQKLSQDRSFGTAILEAIRKQAVKKGFVIN